MVLRAYRDRGYASEIQRRPRALLGPAFHAAEEESLPVSSSDPQDLRFLIFLEIKQRIALFMSLFRGREDVYSRRWENADGRSGYKLIPPVARNALVPNQVLIGRVEEGQPPTTGVLSLICTSSLERRNKKELEMANPAPRTSRIRISAC
jgi:hypothetical protein